MYQANGVLTDDRAIAMPARAGETLFIEGEACTSFLEIRHGVARAVDLTLGGERQVTAFFFPGEFLGLPLSRKHRYSAEAASDLLYVRHSSLNWRSGMAQSGEAEDRLFSAVWQEERSFMDRGLFIGRVGALARMAAFLLSSLPKCTASAGTIEFPLWQIDIASYLATCPETVCRNLRQLREMKIIAMPRKDRLIVQDRARLAVLAEGTHE